jgi:hypothetical protein
MRHKLAGLAAAIVVTISAAPAMACYNPCTSGLFGAIAGGFGGYGYGGGYSYGNNYAYTQYEQLPQPVVTYARPQYYYANQGPTYTGPGDFAPAPSYQERAVTGYQDYTQPYSYGYNGGPYGDATTHYYDGASVQGPAVYTYQPRRAYRSYFRPRPRYYANYGYRTRYGTALRRAYAPRFYTQRYAPAYGPRVTRQYRAPYRHAPLRRLY